MKPCPHKHVEARIWSRHFGDWTLWQPGGSFVADALICRDCGEWLGVGESNDLPVAVCIELRAATLVAGDSTDDGCESCGWCNSQSGSHDPPLSRCNRDDFDAGYLSREIEMHDVMHDVMHGDDQ